MVIKQISTLHTYWMRVWGIQTQEIQYCQVEAQKQTAICDFTLLPGIYRYSQHVMPAATKGPVCCTLVRGHVWAFQESIKVPPSFEILLGAAKVFINTDVNY